MKASLFIISISTTLTSFSQTEIKIKDVREHIGDSVKVCAIVRGIKHLENVKGQPTFLDYGGTFPNAPLTLVVLGNVRNQFEDLELYKGSYVCLTGKIMLYKEKPQIILRSKEQIISVVKDEEVQTK